MVVGAGIDQGMAELDDAMRLGLDVPEAIDAAVELEAEELTGLDAFFRKFIAWTRNDKMVRVESEKVLKAISLPESFLDDLVKKYGSAFGVWFLHRLREARAGIYEAMFEAVAEETDRRVALGLATEKEIKGTQARHFQMKALWPQKYAKQTKVEHSGVIGVAAALATLRVDRQDVGDD